MEQELDLQELWHVLVKRKAMLILIPLLAAVASAAVSLYLLAPQYAAETTLMVTRPSETGTILYQDIQVSRQLVATYRRIVHSRRVLDPVISSLALPYTAAELRKQVEVTSERDTEIIVINVTQPDPAAARDIANEVARSFMRQIVEIMKVENVSIIDQASLPASPVSPRVQLNVAVAFVVGFMAAFGLAFLLEYLDKTIKTPEDVQKYLQLPVLGIIPYVEEN
jgi:capsular polysaccharide biosynthesis protein